RWVGSGAQSSSGGSSVAALSRALSLLMVGGRRRGLFRVVTLSVWRRSGAGARETGPAEDLHRDAGGLRAQPASGRRQRDGDGAFVLARARARDQAGGLHALEQRGQGA